MSKHRKVKKAAKRTVTVTTAVVATSLLFAPTALTAGDVHAVGVGGFRDAEAERIPPKINGFAGTFSSYTPIVSQDPLATPFTWSVAKDVPALEEQIRQNAENGDQTAVITYSRGTLVAAQVQRKLGSDPDAPEWESVVFYYIATPNNPDGGLYSRYPGLPVPGLAFDGALPETEYTTYVIYREYDPWADSPDDLANPLSAINSLMAIRYVHPDEYYDTVSQEDIDDSVTTVSSNSVGGTTVITRLPTRQLPLLGPVRELSAIFGLTGVTEPFVKLVEPTLKWGVDLGYDRTNDESVPTPATPGSSLLRLPGALPDLPGSVQQGVEDAQDELSSDSPLSPSDGGGDNDPSGGPGNVGGTNQVQSFSAPPQEELQPEPEPEPEPVVAPKKEDKDDSDDGLDMTTGGKFTPGDTKPSSKKGGNNPLTQAVNDAVNSFGNAVNGLLGKKPKPADDGPQPSEANDNNSGSSEGGDS